MIDTKLLRHLVAVASHPSVQAAADSLHLTQPALTKSISRFEERIGAKLFDRSGHKLQLTELGSLLLKRGEHLLRQLREMEEEVNLWRECDTGNVEIGIDPSAEFSLLPKVLKRFVPSHPRVAVSIRSGTTESLLPALLDGDLHLLVSDAELADNHDNLTILPLEKETLVPAVRSRHPLVKTTMPLPEEIARYPIIGAPIGPRFDRWQDERGFELRGKPFFTSLKCDNYEVLIRLTEESDAIVFAPHKLLRSYETAGRIKVMKWPINGPEMRTSLIHSKSRSLSPAARLLAQLFIEESG
jgi:DNA-binding transcriptional LysR family regulator